MFTSTDTPYPLGQEVNRRLFLTDCALGLAVLTLENRVYANQVPGEEGVYPGADWLKRRAEELGLSAEKLGALAKLVGGRGCVVRHGCLAYGWGDLSKSGDIASAVKPVISTLLLLAVQQGKVKEVDAAIVEFEPRLRALNHGKDAGITWRHLASQIR